MIAQCHRHKVPFFLKQLGTAVVDGDKPVRLENTHGTDWAEWPADLKVREVPKFPKVVAKSPPKGKVAAKIDSHPTKKKKPRA